jgi:hypothetical protein
MNDGERCVDTDRVRYGIGKVPRLKADEKVRKERDGILGVKYWSLLGRVFLYNYVEHVALFNRMIPHCEQRS